jgi:lipid II:glycine glycyltransferase (peptidoglycan interpeptide bridge formation enzyme)
MMGAGAPGDGGYGVREFKAKFGGELKEFGRFKYVSDKFLYNVGKVGVSLMKRL